MKFHRKDSYGEERWYPEPHKQDLWTELTGTKTASKRQMIAYAGLTGQRVTTVVEGESVIIEPPDVHEAALEALGGGEDKWAGAADVGLNDVLAQHEWLHRQERQRRALRQRDQAQGQ
jgi:hypothetical protein